jgi:type IV secretory pathway component VirB8
MRPNQVYVNGIITNKGFRLERPARSITFIAELTTLAVVLAVVLALAIVIQPI